MNIINIRIFNRLIFIILLFTVSIAYAKPGKVNNSAFITMRATSESSFNLQITLKPKDNFTRWSLGFFMLHVFLNRDKVPFTAQICKQKSCIPLILDIANNNKIAESINSYLEPELTFGHITLFKPLTPLRLEAGSIYIININGLKGIPKNITAMPQKLFLVSNNYKKVIPFQVTKYIPQDNIKGILQERNKTNWYLLKNPQLINSIVVPLPQKTVFSPGKTKAAANQHIHHCTMAETTTWCTAIRGQAEGYVLQIANLGITIYSNTGAGIFYARQTLAQLANYYKNSIPNQTITDYPRFQYRGFMLDTARHFFNVTQLKHVINIMAEHKLNVLHLHLADDEAWRIQLPHFPQLTNIGSKRVFKGIIGPSNLVDETYDITNFSKLVYARADTLYPGYYSISDIHELVAYANARQITIIPEIEMPGHAKALKKSMPEVFFDINDKSRYLSIQGYNDSVLPICKYSNDPEFSAAINNLIKDITALFARQPTINYKKNEISLSGDEVPANAYTDFDKCNIGVYKDLQGESISHEFFKQLSNNLPGYKISGYQQLVQTNSGIINSNAPVPGVTGHIWQWQPTNHKPVSGLDMSASLSMAGYPTVLNFANLTYFDIRYSSKWEEPGLYWAANQTDTFSALTTGLSIDHITNTRNILGVEGALWSELIPSEEHLFYMALPKMSGLAEAAWTDKKYISWLSLAVRLGCGKSGFLAYLNKKYHVRYRGYPNGIKLEVPAKKLCN
ncbi:MAG: hypothetical protein K0R94_1234 [Burkholderiales bacterium]|nr:hypothetical protein [Burkholderiales bacterium]